MSPSLPRVEVHCDLCGCAASHPRYQLARSAIVSCAACGFSFVSPRLGSDTLLGKLQYWAEQDMVDAERLAIAFDARTMELYGRYVDRLGVLAGGKRGKLLDIGCSTGAFMVAAHERGWTVEGLEAGVASSRYAREQQGLTVHEARIEDFAATPSSYDAIVLLEVLEHLQEPSAALAKIASWLKPGGLLLLSTPNFDSLYRRLHGARWWVVNCEDEHIMFFTPATLERALARAGLQTQWLHVRGFDLAGIVSQALGRAAAFRRAGAEAAAAMLATGAPATAHADAASLSDGEVGTNGVAASASATGDSGYHRARARKQQLKRLLASARLTDLARLSLRALDAAFSAPRSPLFGLGEQLVTIARRGAGS